ncbi:MAG: glutamine-hydrolyzing GMP synthase [Candidatus Odinarchaeota archaeon]
MIAIIDFGSQLCHLISKRVRQLGVYTEIVPHDISLEKLTAFDPEAVILSGGPSSIFQPSSPKPEPAILDMDLPVLGICYGHQLLANHLGGEVVPGSNDRHYGIMEINIKETVGIFEGLDPTETVVLSHGDLVKSLPNGFEVLARSEMGVLAFQSVNDQRFGIQFHPEVYHTKNGTRILDNFLKLAEVEKDWLPRQVFERSLNELAAVKEPVLMAVSGGVDSTVAAAIVSRTVPHLLHCVMVDNGLLRKGEGEEITAIFTKYFPKIDFRLIDARELFLSRLKGVIDPEEKRKIIGATFIEVFERVTDDLEASVGKFKYLCQGTIYPDRIESSAPSKNASVIKTHHNVGGLPEKMRLKVIEPLKELYKNEVREIGTEMGLPANLLNRHPFPGPGLAVRCLGEVTAERLAVLRQCDAILSDYLKREDRYGQFWQAFAVLTGIHTTGVQGDDRTYQECVALRLVESVDAMTADVPDIPVNLLKKIATQIVNRVENVNRVVFDLTTKPPATIEWE